MADNTKNTAYGFFGSALSGTNPLSSAGSAVSSVISVLFETISVIKAIPTNNPVVYKPKETKGRHFAKYYLDGDYKTSQDVIQLMYKYIYVSL